jgi:hypothetical protein
MGERTTGYFTATGDGPFDVCELCAPTARSYGLTPNPVSAEDVQRARSTGTLRGIWQRCAQRLKRTPKTRAATASDVSGVVAPTGDAAVPVALAVFNESSHVRMLAGLYRTLGAPRASAVPRSVADREVVLTVAWDIVWYQFRIRHDGRIDSQRGTYVADLAHRWQSWNCLVNASGSVSMVESERGAAR